jgi:hypothetical protein
MISFKKDIDGLMSAGFSKQDAIVHIQQRLDSYAETTSKSVATISDRSIAAAEQRTGHLVTLATILITASGLYIAQPEIHLNSAQKIIVVSTFILLILSIFIGITDYFVARFFYRKRRDLLKQDYRGVWKGVAEGQVSSIEELYARQEKSFADIKESSGDTLGIVQAVLVAFGAASFVMLLVSVLQV